jgi:sulfatase modifying factor 1
VLPAGCNFKTAFNRGSTRGGQKPVSDIDWCDAWAFCKFVGKRLCAETEYQFACNGGITGRSYPYGNTFDASVCNGGQFGAPTDPGQMTGCASPLSSSLVDMSGNMDEWQEHCLTATGPGDTCYTSGGDWKNDSAGELMCSAIYPRTRSTYLDYVGFRCCKSLP